MLRKATNQIQTNGQNLKKTKLNKTKGPTLQQLSVIKQSGLKEKRKKKNNYKHMNRLLTSEVDGYWLQIVTIWKWVWPWSRTMPVAGNTVLDWM